MFSKVAYYNISRCLVGDEIHSLESLQKKAQIAKSAIWSAQASIEAIGIYGADSSVRLGREVKKSKPQASEDYKRLKQGQVAIS